MSSMNSIMMSFGKINRLIRIQFIIINLISGIVDYIHNLYHYYYYEYSDVNYIISIHIVNVYHSLDLVIDSIYI